MEQIRQQLDKLLGSLLNGQPLGWNNVLDVVIVAVFIYYVLVLIRGTKAVQLLIGVLVLVLIYWIAVLLRLTLTTLLLQALFAVALIALVVVFQPELRRGLLQLGQLGPLNRLLVPGTEEEVQGVVDELVRAALLISEAKHGALVVVVSEETQAISIASNGRMIGGLDEERLRRVLSSLLRSRIQPLPFRRQAS